MIVYTPTISVYLYDCIYLSVSVVLAVTLLKEHLYSVRLVTLILIGVSTSLHYKTLDIILCYQPIIHQNEIFDY